MFRSPRPDFIETLFALVIFLASEFSLFRSPRPDFIETIDIPRRLAPRGQLFRSPRPDFIETIDIPRRLAPRGQLFRSPRPDFIETPLPNSWSRTFTNCSGLQDRTSLRLLDFEFHPLGSRQLFRSPRPDFIEAYSQATCQPVKPLVRARLRMAVNKPH